MSDDLVRRWSCDQDNRGARNCRNPYGCHCREITASATAIEEARAEIERLKVEADKYCEWWREERDKNATLRARVREVVGPFGNLAQRYDDTVSDGWIPWIEFITDHEWPSELDCRAARQLMEEVK